MCVFYSIRFFLIFFCFSSTSTTCTSTVVLACTRSRKIRWYSLALLPVALTSIIWLHLTIFTHIFFYPLSFFFFNILNIHSNSLLKMESHLVDSCLSPYSVYLSPFISFRALLALHVFSRRLALPSCCVHPRQTIEKLPLGSSWRPLKI